MHKDVVNDIDYHYGYSDGQMQWRRSVVKCPVRAPGL